MPSPFPGMDPFIEAQHWTSFHHQMIAVLVRTLGKRLRPKYEVLPEERIYLQTTSEDRSAYRADVTISESGRTRRSATHTSAQLELQPKMYELPEVQEEREPFVMIRRAEGHEIVAVIELLSPSNKRRGSVGRSEYLSKRMELLRSPAHLVEIDLLLGGERMPSTPALEATTDFCAFVCRASERPRAEVFEWTLRDSLPPIPVPLRDDDEDALIQLQESFAVAYDELGFQFALNYRQPPTVTARPDLLEWIQARAATML